MILNVFFTARTKVGNDHEVEFHEIEIKLFHEIEITIMRLNLYLVMRSKLSNNIDQEVDTSSTLRNPNKHYFLFQSHDRSCG